jgi:hypothetical protein
LGESLGGIRRGAFTGEGWWKLTSGIAEAAATVGLLILAARLLGTKFVRRLAEPATNRP